MLQHRLPNHKMLCLTVFHLYFVILYNTMGMSHLKAYIKVGHWQVQEESKMSLKKKSICSLPYQQHITLISCPLQCSCILHISIGLGPALKWIQQTECETEISIQG